MTEETLSFQAEVSRLLDIVTHSLYSEKEIFLRELISNASDACDRVRYAALTEPALTADDPELRIIIQVDKDAGTLSVIDNGVGMDRADLVENLGTIARSGTTEFLSRVTGDGRNDLSMIGQFGVGFYASFMVADHVDVFTRKAGDAQGWHWRSSGHGNFTVAEADDVPRGTRVTLTLKADDKEYLEESRISHIIKTYSDHIAFPIRFGTGDDAKSLNLASAVWTRPKSELDADAYKEFYHHVAHAFDEPWMTVHWRAEGMIEYTGLLFVPTSKPFDLFDPKRAHQVKLYVRRVFITQGAEGLIPPYLRFLRGVVDSEDLPLNVSREMLQNNPMLAKLRSGITKRVLSDLLKKAEDAEAREPYAAFWNNFGAVVKEGLYEDFENRDTLLKLVRFRSSRVDGLVSLAEYVERAKDGQDEIYFITGDDVTSLARSPQLEGFRAKDVEVLLLTDPVDEFWIPLVQTYAEKPFKSVTRGDISLDKIAKPGGTGDADGTEPDAAAPAAGVDNLVALLKVTLKDAVKDVRTSDRLTDSAVCLVAAEGDMDMHLERLLRQHQQFSGTEAKRILEINPRHALVRTLSGLAGESGASEVLDDAAWLLLDQARILEGEPLPDPVAFTRRLSGLVERGLTAGA